MYLTQKVTRLMLLLLCLLAPNAAWAATVLTQIEFGANIDGDMLDGSFNVNVDTSLPSQNIPKSSWIDFQAALGGAPLTDPAGGPIGGVGFLVGEFFSLSFTVEDPVSNQLNYFSFILGGGVAASATINGSSVTVTAPEVIVSPIPLPAAAWLFLSALGGLVIAARRRTTATST